MRPRTLPATVRIDLWISLLLLGLLAACGGSDSAPAPPTKPAADLVLLGGTIVTLEDAQPEVSALAARDGVIVALGDDEAIRAHIGDGTTVVELDGRFGMPGFIEGHGHFLGMGDSAIQLDLRGAQTWDEIVAQVADAAKDVPAGTWIRGRGWHQDKWSAIPEPNIEGFPLHESLSAAAPDHPVMLTHASGHATFVNAQALKLAKIDSKTPNPAGGEILRDARGRATGLLRETASGLVQQARSADGTPPVREIDRMITLASEECLRNGITSFHDAGTPFAAVDALKQAATAGQLSTRLWVMIRDSNEALREKLASYQAFDGGGFLKVGGIKLSIDGALGSRGAWLLEPYTDAPHVSGLNLIPLDEAQETAEIALEHNAQLCIHAIGDRANREVLDLYEAAFAAHPDATDLRWRVEHAQHLHPDDIPRFAEMGVTASMQGVHCTSDGPWVPDRIGDQRSEEGAYMWRTLADSGALIVNGTDAPVEAVSPIASYYASVSRMLPDGTRFYEDQRMGRLEALKTYTVNAAQSVFEEGEKGSLAVGKLADITVLSDNLLTMDEAAIPGTEVIYTIVGGRVAYEK